MPIRNPRELFVLMLSDLRQSAQKAPEIFSELRDAAEDPEVKEALTARVFVEEKVLEEIDKCFELIGERPAQMEGRLQEVFAENFRNSLQAIESPEARRLYVLAKANQLVNFRIGEYNALIAASEMTGHPGVGILLESALADKMAFVERTKDLIRARVLQRAMA